MVFNSITFLVFFVLFFFTYWWVSRKGSVKTRNAWLIIGSYIFYGWWDWRFLSLIIISSLADFGLGISIFNSRSARGRKIALVASLLINLGLLGFFKYFNFFIESFARFLELFGLQPSISTLAIILPVGISFYTFQTMSYTIDIYRKKLEPTRSILQFMAFVSFFPQLVAGPIERATRFLPQFSNLKTFDYQRTVGGLRLVLWGFFKKVVIADNMGVVVNALYAQPENYPGWPMLLGAVLFAFQIYADFSGYSDIAIGLGRMLGFDLMTNFRKPYFSKSLTEFWHRWHISLSTWFRDYVYIPLGGNRKGRFRTDLNLLVTFVLSGLWHGASFTFVIWGFVHGLSLIAEKHLSIKKMPVWWVFLLCSLFWIPFRAQGLGHLKSIGVQLLKWPASFRLPAPIQEDVYRLSAVGFVLLIFIAIEKWMKEYDFNDFISRFSKPVRYLAYYLLVLLILGLGNYDVKPYFIYFQF